MDVHHRHAGTSRSRPSRPGLPRPGATGVAVATAPTATFSEDVQQATIAMELRAPGEVLVPSTTAYNATTRIVTLTPNAVLAGTTTYTVNLSGARDQSNNLMDPVTWTFTTETPDTTKPTVTARTPAPGATGVAVNSAVTATFSEAVQQADDRDGGAHSRRRRRALDHGLQRDDTRRHSHPDRHAQPEHGLHRQPDRSRATRRAT